MNPSRLCPRRGKTVRSLTVVAGVVVGLSAPARSAGAQLPDTYVIPRGALRIAFDPLYTNYNRLFDTDGSTFKLGTFYSTDALGSAFLPTLAESEDAIRSITGDTAFRMSAGRFTSRQDGDTRLFPLDFSLGLSSRLTLSVTVPIVTTRVQSATAIDSAGANVGWNQALTGGDSTGGGLTAITGLFMELDAAAAALEMDIAAGSFGCPGSAQCDAAGALVDRIRALAANLTRLTGASATGFVNDVARPPFAPLVNSEAGQALLAAIAAVDAELQAFGQVALTSTLPLPTGIIANGDINTILTDPVYGYDARTLDPEKAAKLSRFGDIEVGLRYAVANGDHVRAVLGARARLPTGFRDSPDDYLDVGPGDRQLDLEWTLDAAIEPGTRLGVWLGGSYTLQMSDRLTRRIAPPTAPIALASSARLVDRDLGEILAFSVHPALRLTDQFRVFVSAYYRKKTADKYTAGGTAIPELEALTASETWSFGAGMWFRADRGRRTGSLPIEAGVLYRSAFSGNGGNTPQQNSLGMSLRLFYRLWGGPPPPPAPPVDEER
ncbi:MAG TPA: hypothetical protein VGA37_01945 [Gemmatimonadales bacterium]